MSPRRRPGDGAYAETDVRKHQYTATCAPARRARRPRQGARRGESDGGFTFRASMLNSVQGSGPPNITERRCCVEPLDLVGADLNTKGTLTTRACAGAPSAGAGFFEAGAAWPRPPAQHATPHMLPRSRASPPPQLLSSAAAAIGMPCLRAAQTCQGRVKAGTRRPHRRATSLDATSLDAELRPKTVGILLRPFVSFICLSIYQLPFSDF